MRTPAHDLATSRLFLSHEDVDLIQRLVDKMFGSVVVDLGAGGGTTALAVLTAPFTAHISVVYTVDKDPANLDWARMAVANVGELDRWVPVYGHSWGTFAAHPDLLLVDAGHEYNDVTRDLEQWIPRMETGDGYIWFDDYSGEYPGVTVAVNERIRSGQLLEIERAGKSIATRLRDH